MATPHVTESEPQKAPEALNSNEGAGPDGLIPYIAPTISRIFNLSLETSQIPDDWFHAIVTPVKKHPTQQTQTYSGPTV